MLQLVKDGEELNRVGDVPAQLRRIAEDIESGALVGITSAAVVMQLAGGDLSVHGIRDGDPVTRLNAAYMLLSLALRELERVAVAADR